MIFGHLFITDSKTCELCVVTLFKSLQVICGCICKVIFVRSVFQFEAHHCCEQAKIEQLMPVTCSDTISKL